MTETRQKQNRPWLDRVAFFQERLPETLHPFELEKIRELIQEFLDRHNEELETLKVERRSGRPPSTRQTLLEQAIKAEAGEFESGFWLPDLQDVTTLEKLDQWKGNWQSLGTMKFVRVPKEGSVKESQFPPRGAS